MLVISILFYLPWITVFLSQFNRLFLDMLPFKFQEKFGFNGFYLICSLLIILMFGAIILLFYLLSKKQVLSRMYNYLKNITINPGIIIGIFLIWLGVNVIWQELFFGNLFYIRYTLFLFPFFYIFLARKLLTLNHKTWLYFCLIIFIYLPTLRLLPVLKIKVVKRHRRP